MTWIGRDVALVDLGPVDELMMLLLGGLATPGEAVMLRHADGETPYNGKEGD